MKAPMRTAGAVLLVTLAALSMAGAGEERDARRRAVEDVHNALKADTGTSAGIAVRALVAMDQSVALEMVDGLSMLSESDDLRVHSNAAFAVSEIGRLVPSSVEEPLRRLSDGDEETRRLAARVLGLLQRTARRVLARLAAGAARPSEAFDVRRTCIDALGAMRIPAASTARTLRSLARDEHPLLRTSAARALFSVHPDASAHE